MQYDIKNFTNELKFMKKYFKKFHPSDKYNFLSLKLHLYIV